MGRTSNARERMIEAATELIHDRGYTAVGVSEVCQQSGVNKGSFYHFFPSKQQLVLEVIESYWERQRGLFEQLKQTEGSPLERLRSFLAETGQAAMACSASHHRGCLLGNLALELSTQDDDVRQRIGEIFESQYSALESVIAAAVEAGEVESIEPRRGARSILAYLSGVTLLAKAHNEPAEIGFLGSEALRLIGAKPHPA